MRKWKLDVKPRMMKETADMETQTMDEFLNTLYIKEIVEEFYADQTEEKCFNIAGHLILRMNEGGKAPMPLVNITRIVLGLNPALEMDEVFPGEVPEIFITYNGKDGTKWLPLFTDRSEMKGLEKTNPVKEVPITEIISKVFESEEYAGVIINPETDDYVIVKEACKFLLEKAEELKKEAC